MFIVVAIFYIYGVIKGYDVDMMGNILLMGIFYYVSGIRKDDKNVDKNK